MAASEDLIDFDVIESQKENIQSLPGGRSAKKLADLFGPSPLEKRASPNPNDTKTINDGIRAEFEAELLTAADLDDPLDVYDRFVGWTLDAYPSAQATPQSQLHTLLERATKAFIGSAQYKNDPRYLKIWLRYIQFFSDAPREAFMYLSRHGIGEGLALFYEEYAAWLESAGRWAQAEEVYKLGIERDARPQQRLVRKFGEFEQRRAQLADGEDQDSPSSPALPSVRPVLAAKIDPFVAAGPVDPQAPRQHSGVGGGRAGKPAKSKLAIFSDADAAAPALSSRDAGSKGWESIGSLADRKKENVVEPTPWVGETLKAGGRKASGPKMAVFRDKSLLLKSHIPIVASQHQVTVNPQVGKRQRIVFDLRVLYPTPDVPGSELSFEEVLLARGGWLDAAAPAQSGQPLLDIHPPEASPPKEEVSGVYQPPPSQIDLLSEGISQKLVIHRDIVPLDENGAMKEHPRAEGRPKKKKMMEVNETQIIKAKLDSPSRPKLKKRGSSEPTMTMHTRAATDDIYDIFNAPLKPAAEQGEEASGDEEDYDDTDGDYTSGAESTVTTTRRLSVSEAGDDEEEEEADDLEVVDADETSDVKSVSEWSDFTARKHIPVLDQDALGGDDGREGPQPSELGSDPGEDQQSDSSEQSSSSQSPRAADADEPDTEMSTPADEEQPRTRTVFVPIPPEDYVAPRRPYRDAAEMANNRLPFMTPITERTETDLSVASGSGGRASFAKTPSKCRTHVPSVGEDEDEEMGGEDYEPDHGDDEDDDDDNDDEEAVGSALEPLSSPLQETVSERPSPAKANRAQPTPPVAVDLKLQRLAGAKTTTNATPISGPVIQDVLCNPVSPDIQAEILAAAQPPLSSEPLFFDHRPARYEKGADIRRCAKAVSLKSRRRSGGADKTGGVQMSVVVELPGSDYRYTLKKELGAGAFAPVYLVEGSRADAAQDEAADPAPLWQPQRGGLEAIKMESPPSVWEFHMMRLAHSRLGPRHRATQSLSSALEMHVFEDEGFLVLPFHPHGTLLDLVNLLRAETSGAMDEVLAMFFTVELLRTVEALHERQILHGDLKADNCLVRIDGGGAVEGDENSDGRGCQHHQLSPQWRADGSGGWAWRGVTLIDFGRGIDMRAFRPEAQFVADWKTSAADCAEMREGRPWTWQIDYHGLAGTVHTLLFGKYLETVRCDQAGGGSVGVGGHNNASLGGAARRYRIRENLKRYWQTELWGDCFDLLLNPAAHVEAEAGARMPVLRGMRRVREAMESWLEVNCERGVGLKGLLGRFEATAKARR